MFYHILSLLATTGTGLRTPRTQENHTMNTKVLCSNAAEPRAGSQSQSLIKSFH